MATTQEAAKREAAQETAVQVEWRPLAEGTSREISGRKKPRPEFPGDFKYPGDAADSPNANRWQYTPDTPPLEDALIEELYETAEGQKEMVINFGPQHPSTHGVLRVAVRVDGEAVKAAEPDIGYLHRCHEKLNELWAYPGSIALSDRLDYLAAMTNELAFVLAVEKLLGIVPSERAQYIRVVCAELQRIASHLMMYGTTALDLGATTPFLYCWKEREYIYDVFEYISGARMLYHYMRFGGVRTDFPPGTEDKIRRYLDDLEKRLPEYHDLLTYNPIFEARTRGVGVLSREDAIAWGASGPIARASGVDYDLRRDDPYLVYDQLEFNVPVETAGDVWARYVVRMKEIEESIKLIRQALDRMPEGDARGAVPRFIKPPPGEVYQRIDGPRGELGCLVVADGTDKPYRCHWRTPSFVHLQLLKFLPIDHLVADLVAIIGSIDPVFGEVDK